MTDRLFTLSKRTPERQEPDAVWGNPPIAVCPFPCGLYHVSFPTTTLLAGGIGGYYAVVNDVIFTPTLLRTRIRILPVPSQSVVERISFDLAKVSGRCRMPA